MRLARQSASATVAPPEAWLTAGERARWQAFGHEQRRATFVAGRWLLRLLLAERSGGAPVDQRADIDADGRTVLDGGLFANLSHSGDWLCVALAEAPVGVDIERIRTGRDWLGMARLVHGEAQCRELAALDEDERCRRFHAWWTLKEAWLKARGSGLDYATMRALEFVPVERGTAAFTLDAVPGLALAVHGPAVDAAGLSAVSGLGGWQCVAARNA